MFIGERRGCLPGESGGRSFVWSDVEGGQREGYDDLEQCVVKEPTWRVVFKEREAKKKERFFLESGLGKANGDQKDMTNRKHVVRRGSSCATLSVEEYKS